MLMAFECLCSTQKRDHVCPCHVIVSRCRDDSCWSPVSQKAGTFALQVGGLTMFRVSTSTCIYRWANTFNQMKPGQVSYHKYARACISLLMCHFARVGVDLNQLERVEKHRTGPRLLADGSSVGQTSQEDSTPQSDVVGVSWQKEVQKWKVEIVWRLAESPLVLGCDFFWLGAWNTHDESHDFQGGQ